MDFATIAGLIIGSIMLITGIGVKDLGMFIDIPSVLIVIGGTLGSVLITLPLSDVLKTPKVSKHLFISQTAPIKSLIDDMVSYAEIARRDGILALESVTDNIKDEFLVKGIQLAVDGTDPELIQQIMDTEVECMSDRHAKGKKIFDTACKYGPAWGMIGTLIGLVKMLAQMQDPSTIGPSMAVALITTFYGSLLANFIFGPMADKLEIKNDDELLSRQIIIQGVMSIQSGDNPRIVEQKLSIFLPPELRKKEESSE